MEANYPLTASAVDRGRFCANAGDGADPARIISAPAILNAFITVPQILKAITLIR